MDTSNANTALAPQAKYQKLNGLPDVTYVVFPEGALLGYRLLADGARDTRSADYNRRDAEFFVSQGIWRKVSMMAGTSDSVCSCPSGDGSLRWPCAVHPPE